MKESVGITVLVNVLRGAQNQEVFEGNYHLIKTYGAAKDVSYFDLFQYITQMINQGLLEIDYTQHSKLNVTALGESVLFQGEQVKFTQAIDRKAKAKTNQKALIPESYDETLFDVLKTLRREIATEKKWAAYMVFSDKSLKDMAALRPKTKLQFAEISGVGEKKLEMFGEKFLKAILSFES